VLRHWHHWLLTAALLGVVGLGWARPDKPAGKRYALLVGVKAYEDKKLPDLDYTENDVAELADVLREGGYEVVLLTSGEGKKHRARMPTAENVRARLKALLGKATKRDTLLVALSGHGVQLKVKDKDEAFFCPCDGNIAKAGTLISVKDVFRQLDDSKLGLGLLLVDACRDDPRAGRNVDVDNLPRPPRGTAALFSCASGERAYETKKLGKGHGVFFYHVLQGLKGEARNRRGEVTWSSLADYVTDKVSDDVPTLIGGGARQSPHKIENLVGKSPVLLQAAKLAKEFRNSIGMKLVLIPRGTFEMGSAKEEARRKPDEGRHAVEIARPFWMGVHEVTQKQYRDVMKKNPSYFSPDGAGKDEVKGDTDDFPVETVSWDDAVDFCKKLSRREKGRGWTYRLPREAEWEYACRATTTAPFHFGKSLSSAQANFDGRFPYGGAKAGRNLERPGAVGSYDPNDFGLFDMHGNVSEWCQDWYDKDYKGGTGKEPRDPEARRLKVVRGGAWNSIAAVCRSASRHARAPAARESFIGFRVAAEPAARGR
jgi:formylglycine-generating enzyme required for sulfatase activity